MTRRRFIELYRKGFAASGSCAGLGVLISAYQPVVNQVRIPINGLPAAFDGFRIGGLSSRSVVQRTGHPARCQRTQIDPGAWHGAAQLYLFRQAMSDRTIELANADKRCIWHPFTQMRAWCGDDHEPLVIVDGQGAVVRDSRGREYIDGNSSIWTNIHGHRHPGITTAIKTQLDRIAHCSFLGATNEPAIALASRLVEIAPGSALTRVFYSDDGSTAVEVAVKMALQYWQLKGQPQRKRFVAFDQAYHGDTAGAASLGGLGAFFDRFAPVHFPVLRVTDTAGLESLDSDTANGVAAVIVEPLVQGAAGIRLWPEGMLKHLRNWCNHTGSLLIFDEVLTGFGRTGKMFACEHEGVAPDFLCLAKGLTGGNLPLAATLTTEEVFSAFLGNFDELKTFFYGHSYCGNPLGCAAAVANLEAFREEQTLDRLIPKIELLTKLLTQLAESPHVAEVRQRGFIAGVQLQKSDGSPLDWRKQTGARVCLAARERGLLTRPILDTVAVIPPLCITETQLEQAITALGAAIDDVCEPG